MSAENASETPAEQEETPPGTFTGRINTDALETALDAAQATNDEAVVEITTDGMTWLITDPANVLMAKIEIPADAWIDYAGHDLRLGVDLEKMENVATAADETVLEWDTSENRLHVESGPIDAYIATLAPDTIDIQEPKDSLFNDTHVGWDMPTDDFRTAIGVARNIDGGGSVEIHADPVDGDGDMWVGIRKRGDTDRVEAGFDDAEIAFGEGERVEVLQDEEYLKDIRQAVPRDAELRMTARTDWPITIEYSSEGVDVSYVQAPRIEDD